jgi:DNA-binding PadR family transcriptional regulator
VTDRKPASKAVKEPHQELWNLITENIPWINYANLSNSFVILQVLSEAERSLSANEVSERIASNTKGRLYKVPATIRDALEHRLMREQLVEGETRETQTADGRKLKTLHFSLTPKGKTLLKGWTAFVRAYSR